MIVRNNRMRFYPPKNSTILAILAFIFSIIGLAIPNIVLYIIGAILLLRAFYEVAKEWGGL